MTFRVGQKVICIKQGGWTSLHSSEIGPQYGEIYTIEDIEVIPTGTFLTLSEINNPPRYVGFAANFWSVHFRPVVERKTDISIFTAMLKTERQPLLTD